MFLKAKLDQLGFTQEWAQHLKRMCLNQDSNSHPIAQRDGDQAMSNIHKWITFFATLGHKFHHFDKEEQKKYMVTQGQTNFVFKSTSIEWAGNKTLQKVRDTGKFRKHQYSVFLQSDALLSGGQFDQEQRNL